MAVTHIDKADYGQALVVLPRRLVVCSYLVVFCLP